MSTTAKTVGPDLGRKGLFRAPDGKNLLAIFALVTTLFLLWGFCNGLIDILNKHFQSTLHINKYQSGFVQTANYMAYFLMAIPAGLLARKFGYKGGIIIGLVLIATGAFWFVTATQIGAYWAFLTGLFVLAAGMTCLETIANPYTTVLGPAESGATRINIAQTFNGVGWILGPVVGGYFVFGGTAADANAGLYVPYLGIGLVVTVLIGIFVVAKVPDLQAAEDAKSEAEGGPRKPLWRRPHFTLGVLAQFLYVAAQSGIFGFFINYVLENAHDVTPAQAASYLGIFGFGLFMIGRLCGSIVVSLTKPHAALAVYAAVCLALCTVAMWGGWIGLVALLGTFFFMSIMFPTIFALSIRGLGEHTKLGSSLIVMSIVGGAIAPPMMGHIADVASMRVGLLVPAACFVLIAAYAAMWPKLERSKGHREYFTVSRK
jgi:FHS family L-fucose permease-like MFS transporter